MSTDIELKVGDVVRLTVPFTAVVTDTDISLNFTVEVGNIFTVSGFDGSNVLLQRFIKVDGTHVDIVMHVSPENLQAFVPVQTDEGEDTETPPTQPSEGEDDMTCEKRRYSKATIRATTKRPEVALYQGALATTGDYTGDIDSWYGAGSAKSMKEGFQARHDGLDNDGVIGGGTSTVLIKEATEKGFVADLNPRIMSIIAFYEVGNRQDAYGMAENDIGDDAGANYGIFQCNSLGSVDSMLRLAERNDLRAVYNGSDKSVVNPTIKDWFGSSDGIATQNQYFEENTLNGAMKELRAFGLFDVWENDPEMQVWWGRAILLFCDSRIQNGTMWSSKRRPFWKDLDGSEGRPESQHIPELYHGTWWDEVLGQYIRYEDYKTKWWAEYEKNGEDIKQATIAVNKDIITNDIPSSDPASQLMLLAQTRSRSSSPKWWYQAVASRRVTDATGTSASHPSGVVNGAKIDLACDYQL